MQVLQDSAQIDRQQWKALLETSPYASPFQSPEFFDRFNDLSGPQSAGVYALADGGRLHALCVVTLQEEKGLKGFFSRRAIVYGGPLLTGDVTENWNRLLQVMEKDLRRKAIYLEVRHFHDFRPVYPVYEQRGWEYLPYLNAQVPLEGKTPDDVLANMKYNRRREIRLSLKEGAEYGLARDEAEVRSVYDLLEALYRERVKLPLPGWTFFRDLFDSEVGVVFTVRHEENIIGGAFCLLLPGQGIYTWYYAGLRDYHKKIFSTHLAVLAALEHGLENGVKHLDFMGVGLKDQQYGVRKYKMEFGAEQLEQGRYLKVLNQPLYRVGKLGLAVLQKVK